MYDLSRVLTVMLAGGDGKRFWPLTRIRAKPAVPIAGNFRLVDVPLSNIINADFLTHCYILVQANPYSLSDHLNAFSAAGIATMTHEFMQVIPSNSQRGFYKSDAHSLAEFQHIWNTRDGNIKYDFVIVMMSDQIIRIDPGKVIDQLVSTNADMAMVYANVPTEDARGKLGVLRFVHDKVVELQEKPEEPYEISPGFSAGNIAFYVMKSSSFEYLMNKIHGYSKTTTLSNGALQNIIKYKEVIGYNLADNEIKGQTGNGFFLDIEGVDTLAEFCFDLCQINPKFNFHNQSWPIYTTPRPAMPMKGGSFSGENILLGYNVRIEHKVNLFNTMINRNALIGEGSEITDSLILDHASIGRGCKLHNVVVDKDVVVPGGLELNPISLLTETVDLATYTSKYGTKPTAAPAVPVLTPGGYLVIPKGYKFC